MKINFLPFAILMAAFLLPAICEAQAPTDKQLDAIEKILAPQRQKVLAVLEADKTGQYANYLADLDVITKELDHSKKDALLEKLEANHLDFIRKAYSAAKINNSQIRQEVAKVLGSIQFSIGEFAGIQIEVNLPSLTPPQKVDVTLTCPLAAQEEHDSGIGADSEVFDCTIRLESLAEVATGGLSRGDLGDRFEVMGIDATKVTVVAQTDISYRGWVAAVGGGRIAAKYGIRLQSSSGFDKKVLTKELTALAPVAFYNRLEGTQQNFTSQASFTDSFPSGSSVTAMVHMQVSSVAVGVSFAEMDADSDNVDFIRATATN